jgi:hypothetical protein
MIYAAETTHSNRERKLVQPLEGSPELLRHQHLRDGQADQLGVSDLARAARTAAVDEELVSQAPLTSPRPAYKESVI